MNERIYEQMSDEGLDIITAALQLERRDIDRLYGAVMQERTIRYAERLRSEGYETPYTPPQQ